MPPPSTMSSSSSNISASGLLTGSSGTTPSLPPLDNTLGAILIAEILISMLFGITTLQMYIYFNRNPRDNRWMKGAMIALWVLDAVHLGLNSHTIYHYTVLNFMNPLALLSCPWSFAIVMIIGGLSDAIVTGIFAHRIWRFGGKMWPVMFIIPPMLVGFAGATATCNYALKFPLYEDFKKHYSWTWYTTFITQSFADVAIATTVSVMLIKRRTGFRQTDSAIRTLIVYSINTGALTSSVSVASVIIYAAVPDNLIFIALAMLLPKLMLNSLLALLNSRDSIRDKSNRSEPVSIHLSNLATVSARTVTDEPSQLSGSRSQDPYASDYKDDEILTGIKITRDKVVTVSPA